MRNRYTFSVSAELVYEVEAHTKKEAEKILVKEGGYEITYDDLYVEKKDYENATLISEEKLP